MKFYSTWYMPDKAGASCCSKSDCYPTLARLYPHAAIAGGGRTTILVEPAEVLWDRARWRTFHRDGSFPGAKRIGIIGCCNRLEPEGIVNCFRVAAALPSEVSR